MQNNEFGELHQASFPIGDFLIANGTRSGFKDLKVVVHGQFERFEDETYSNISGHDEIYTLSGGLYYWLSRHRLP